MMTMNESKFRYLTLLPFLFYFSLIRSYGSSLSLVQPSVQLYLSFLFHPLMSCASSQHLEHLILRREVTANQREEEGIGYQKEEEGINKSCKATKRQDFLSDTRIELTDLQSLQDRVELE